MSNVQDVRQELMEIIGSSTLDQVEEFKDRKVVELFDKKDYETCAMQIEFIACGLETDWDDKAWDVAQKVEALKEF